MVCRYLFHLLIMDTEQLKLILEVIRGAGDGAKDVAVMYLLVALVKPVLGTIAGISCVWIVGNTIRKCVNATHECTQAWKRVCEAAGQYPTSYPDSDDIKRVTDKLKK